MREPRADRSSPAAMAAARALVTPPILRRFRVTVTGSSHVPGAGGVLLAANHRSFLDHFILGSASPRAMRFLGKTELQHGLVGRANVALGLIPVTRGSADLAALDAVIVALRAGQVVGIFPEGTRSPSGELFRFRSGMARLAAEAQVPIVPVGLIGTAEVWPRNGRLQWRRPPRGLIQVHFGPLVPAPEPTAKSRREATAAVHRAVAALCGQPLAAGFAPV